MTDKRFHDVVIESQSMIGPSGELSRSQTSSDCGEVTDRAKYHTAICKTCSKQHKVTKDEFQMDDLYRVISTDDGFDTEPANALDHEDEYKEVLQFVAEMRAWNCHHEGETPIDGFPDEPEASRVDFGQ